MVNYKKTIERIHGKCPELSLEQLISIMDCIVEDLQHNIKTIQDLPQKRNVIPSNDWWNNPITTDQILYNNQTYADRSIG